MTNKNQEDYIIKGIFLSPIFSLILFAILIFTFLFFYFQQIQKSEIKEYKNLIINDKKEITKTIVLDVVQNINHSYKDLNKNIKTNLKERINEAQNIINRVIKENPDKSPKELKTILKQVLSSIRFNNGRGYYFIYNYSTKKTLIHPIKKFVNKNMRTFKDKKGVVVVNIIDKVIKKNKEGFATVYFAKPSNPNKEFKKIIYVKYIPKLNWVVGTGEYTQDAMNELKQELLKEITNKRYGKNGYFWIHNIHYILLAHPFRQKDIGKNDENLTDIKGNKVIQMFVKSALQHKNGTFVKYYWQNPSTHTIEDKIGFVYYIPEFKWVIGSGLYLNDLKSVLEKRTQQTKQKIKELIFILFLILLFTTIIVMFIAFILSKHTKNMFEIYKNDLEEKIKEAVKENTEKDKMLQEQSKLAAMGEMIGAIAHQWRQPLNSLGLNIQILIDDFLDGKIDEKYLGQFEEKQMQIIKFMSKTIDDFRNFFKIDKQKQNFSVKNSIKEVIEIVNAQLKSHNIEVKITGEDFNINGYKSEFNQVILNLINNAKDAILETKKENGLISINITLNKIIISDNGKNIPSIAKNRLFEPYFTTKENGTGIGLYMSKTIIERMGGKIYLTEPKQFIIEGLK